MESAVLKSSRNKNKWGYGIFEQWQKQRLTKLSNVEVSALFKDYDFHLAHSLETYLLEMSASSSVNAADFLSGSNWVKLCRDTSLPHISRGFGCH